MTRNRRAARVSLAALLWLGLCALDKAETPQGQPATPYQAVAMGNARFADGAYTEAVDLYRLALVQLPDAPEIHFDLAAAYFKLFDLDKAEAEFRRALDTPDTHLAALAHFNLGNVRYQMALNASRTFRDSVAPLREAMAEYRAALDLDPTSVDVMYNLELSHRFMEELRAQREIAMVNPASSDADMAHKGGQTVDESTDSDKEPETTEDDQQAKMDPEGGEQGETSQMGVPNQDNAGQMNASGQQQSITQDDAQKLIEMVRQRASEAQNMRQQMRQARMRDAGIDKPW